MTPAIQQARKNRIAFQVHPYDHDPGTESYGEEAALKLGLDPAQVFKTLVVRLDGRQFTIAIVPVSLRVDLKAVASASGAKKADMAPTEAAERATGYRVGGISPLGQKKRLPTLLDHSAQSLDTLHVSAGRRGLEIELRPSDLLALTGGRYAAIAR